MTTTKPNPGLREALHRAQAANRAAQSSLAELDATLEEALKTDVEGGLEEALKDAPLLSEHRRNHRPGRAAKLAADPELRAFVEARLGTMTFNEIESAVTAAFPPERQVKRSAIHDWWQTRYSRTKPGGPR